MSHDPLPPGRTETDPELTGPDQNAALRSTPAESRPQAAGLPSLPGYEVLEELGRGGMGVVYKARQTKLKRLVALKMIRGGAVAGPEELARFRTEAEAVARLQHPNVVQIHEIGEHEGLPYFALEFVDGGSLADQLRTRHFSPRQAAELVETLARAVQAAHARGIVHRDLKPANVLLTSGGTPKLGDFGLAKQVDEDSGQTASGAILGTPSYMAPEQAAGLTRTVGPPCDIHALGAIFYELLTGRPPFRGETIAETLDRVRNEEPVPPRRFRPKLPRDLETICLKCLRKEPGKRYATAEELADDLRRFLEHEPIRARPVGVGERTVKWVRRRPAVALAILLAVLLPVGAAGGYWLWQQREQDRAAKEEADRQVRAQEEAEQAARKEETRYYTAVVKRRGAPEGIGELTAEQASRRFFCYRLFSRGGVVQRVDQVNGHGRLTARNPLLSFLGPGAKVADSREVAAFVFRRDKQGVVTAEEMYDAGGQLIGTIYYTSPTTAHITYRGGLGLPEATAGYVQFSLTKDGFQETLWNMDRNNKLTPNANGSVGIHSDCDPRGLVVKITHLNMQGRPVTLPQDGVAIVTQAYDDKGNQTEEAYFDPGGHPVLRKPLLIHKKTMRYDEVGNLIEENYLGVDGRPAVNPSGIARRAWRYDDHGDQTEEAYFGPGGARAVDPRGVARWTARRDEQGNAIEEAYFGGDDRPVTIPGGYAVLKAKFDERGHRTEERYFNAQGRPVLHWNGFHRVTLAYDERGNRIEESFYGFDDRLAFAQAGYARRTMRYDAKGRNIEEAYFGVDGRPLANRLGFASVQSSYDELGRPSEGRYFGVDGLPTHHKDGYHLVKREYDERGLVKGEAYFGTDEKPILHRDGYARWERQQHVLGDRVLTGWRYFDLQGKIVAHRDGYLFKGIVTDSRGKVTETAYADSKGFTLNKDGYSSWEAKYDDHGNEVLRSYLDTTKKPVANKEGFAVMTGKFDERGNRIEEAYFGPDKKPVLHRNGYHKVQLCFDRFGQPTALKAFGVKDEPLRLQAVVTEVVPGGQGERLGLRAGDVLLTYDGREVANPIALIHQRRLENDSQAAKKLTVLRDGQKREVTLSPGLLGVQMESRAAP